MLFEKIQSDIITAMKTKQEHTLSTLRMAKSVIQIREKEKKGALTDAEVESVLSTLIKQRKDSAEQFTKGDRPELAAKELVEITLLEKYLPQEANSEQLEVAVSSYLNGLAANGIPLTPKLMGSVIKGVKEGLASYNLRADGKMLSELVKKALSN